MEAVDSLLSRARRVLLAGRALSWLVRGIAAAGVAGVLFEILQRVRPLDPEWPGLAGSAGIGLLVAAVGWLRAWPSRTEVARLADLRLGGRERLITALQFASAEGTMLSRQRSDAGAFAAVAQARQVADPGRPVLAAVLAGVAAIAVLALVLAPNPALTELRTQRAVVAAQERAADSLTPLIRQAEKGRPGESAADKQALVQELKRAQSDVRKAPDPAAAVAALSQAQADIKKLQDPNSSTRQQASAAAGKELEGSAADKAGQALAAGDNRTAGAELRATAAGLDRLSQADQRKLADSLDKAAAQSASGNPKLSQSLRKASQALQAGDRAAAAQALQQAADAADQEAAKDDFKGDSAQAVNALQKAKAQLEKEAQPGSRGSAGQGPGQPGSAGNGQPGGSGQGAPAAGGQGGQPAGGSGSGQGQGHGQGQGQGAGSGSGQGGTGAGTGSGGGAGGPGSGRAAASTEKVYIPGQSTGSGDPQGNATGTGSSAAPGDLVPYSEVLAEYQAAATSQVDRQLIPEDERDLVRQYFQDLGK
ncbi:MAG: hypothetical protein NVS9B1_05960 [Candidatus Dormibacteraceae bacterium]